jgi:phosphoribosyl 1,2-cyclic phosphodiesterase
MVITFYGVRGSIPSPGPATNKYGGNTLCVFVELDNGHNLILGAGTGIRKLGKRLETDNSTVNILLSHGHWDHIQGFPFFAPLYRKTGVSASTPALPVSITSCVHYLTRSTAPTFPCMQTTCHRSRNASWKTSSHCLQMMTSL